MKRFQINHMKRQNSKKAQVTPKWMNPEWLYNEIMHHIEPDLTTDKIALLNKKYAKETPEDREARMASYIFSFALFDEALNKVHGELFIKLKEYQERMQEKAKGKKTVTKKK